MNLNQVFPTSLAACAIMCGFSLSVRADEEADRAALRLIRTNYMEAVNTANPSKIAPYLSKEVTGVMVTGEEVKGFEGLVAYWKKIQDLIGPGGSYHVTVNVDKTDLYGDVAVSRGNTGDVVRLGSGKELQFSSFWTAVCHKEDGMWKVVRMEAAMDPVENIFISLRLQKTKLVSGLTGLIAGAILAFVLGRLKGRARSEPAKMA
jgi:hypothetical protein